MIYILHIKKEAVIYTASFLMVTRTGIELNFLHFLTCRDMRNSPYLRHFFTLTRFIMLSFILSF